MTGQDVARILDADGALEERLNKVAPCAEEHNHQAQTHPLRYAEGQFRSAVVQRRCLVETNACCNSEYKDAASDASFPALARTNTWEEFVLAEERTAEVSASIVCPKENKHAKRQQIVVNHAVCTLTECEYVDCRQRQCDIHLRKHCIRPVVYRIRRLCVEFGDEQIDDSKQVRDEHCRRNDARAIASDTEEQVHAGNGGDETVRCDAFYVVHNASKLPDSESGDQCEQKYHRLRTQETRDNGCYEEHTGDGTYNEVFHFIAHNAYVYLFSVCSAASSAAFSAASTGFSTDSASVFTDLSA